MKQDGKWRIHRLDDSIVTQIAAGEVVERPASVVKELLENSVDAGSTDVTVKIADGGLSLIEVSDDGVGIPREDFPLVFERHATSKIQGPLDFVNIRTIGFRGEALASISSVAKVHLVSKANGTKTAFEMGAGPDARMSSPKEAARDGGTTITVRDLFFNTPARKKFLKSSQSELTKISEVVEQTYLANHAASFSLVIDGTQRARYSATQSLKEAASSVFGLEFSEMCFEFSGSGGPGVWMDGVASHPSVTRGTSGRIFFSVNDRPIVSKQLTDSLRAAYADVIPKGRYPLAAVNMRADSEYVDVNVHPSKREVRFRWEGELRDSLRALVASGMKTSPRSAVVEQPRRAWRGPEPAPPLNQPRLQRKLFNTGKGSADMAKPTPIEGTEVHPRLNLLGQVAELYLVGEPENEEGVLVIIDAHAASERMIYERIKANSSAAHQDLLVPVEIELSVRQEQVLKQFSGDIASMGFVVEHFGGRTHRITGVPSYLWHRVEPSRLIAILDELSEQGGGQVESPHERMMKSVACHMAIRGGDSLTMEEMERLVKELYATGESFTCPHGRPIMVTLKREELDRWFHRPTK